VHIEAREREYDSTLLQRNCATIGAGCDAYFRKEKSSAQQLQSGLRATEEKVLERMEPTSGVEPLTY
jgi:hypothetical protein